MNPSIHLFNRVPGVSVTVLRSVPIFERLSDETLANLGCDASIRHFKRGQTIFHDGDPSRSVYVVLSGRLQVVGVEDDGREIIIAQLAQGDMFGEMGLLDHVRRSATVVAAEPSSAVEVAPQAFLDCMSANSDVAAYVVRNLVSRLRAANQTIKNLALSDVAERTRRVLSELSVPEGDVRVIPYKISRNEIAKMIGASREMVSRVMIDLLQRGLIQETHGRIRIRQSKPPELRHANA